MVRILGLDAITGANLFLFNSLLSKYSNFETLVKVHSLLEGPEFSSEVVLCRFYLRVSSESFLSPFFLSPSFFVSQNTFDVLKRLLSSAVTQSDERIRMSLLQMLARLVVLLLLLIISAKIFCLWRSSDGGTSRRSVARVLNHTRIFCC